MKICYLSNTRFPWCTETHITKTLQSMGHEVVNVQEDTATHEELMATAMNCDLFLWTRTWSRLMTLSHLEVLKDLGIPTVSFHLDAYVGLRREDGLNSDPFWRTQFVFSPDGDPHSAEVFKAKGINHHHLWPGVYDAECYMVEAPQTHPIIFVGSYINYHPEFPYRFQLVQWLQKTYGSAFEVWGPQGKGLVRGDDLNRLYGSSTITIGDTLSQGFTHEKYTSDRLFEATGRGAFLIYPRIKGLDELFVDGKEVVFYDFGNFDQLAQLIQYYLTHDEEREAIRKAGFERTKREHTYRHRMEQMLEVLRTEGAIK